MKISNDKGELSKIVSPNSWVMLGLGTALFLISMSFIYPSIPKEKIWIIAIIIFLVDLFIMAIIYIAWSALISLRKKQLDTHFNRHLAGDFISNSDNYWYHWEYTKRDREWIARYTLFGGFLAFLACPLFLSVLFIIKGIFQGTFTHYKPTGDLIQDFINLFGKVIITGFAIGLIPLVTSFFQAIKRLIKIPDVYIGENSIYEDGKYWCWEGTPYQLSKIELVKRVLNFEVFYQVQENEKDRNFAPTMRWFGDEPTGQISRSIFVPLGQETAVNEVVERLSKKCIPQRKMSRIYDSSGDYLGDSYYSDNDSSDSGDSCSWGDSGDSGDSCSSND
ncbi:MAG TPA: hypothetical protein DCQ51_16035 [Planktothrix sp. UBA8407]|nr:hypothetical protein [Planktothrix sp. UBA8407]HBK24033.1 hypothetical protein [Planktothrix sp. UBA10369]